MNRTILLVDDHPVVRAGCRSLLAEAGPYRLVEAADVAAALDLWQRERPDAVVLDLNLPGDGSGLDLLRRMLAGQPGLPVLIFSMHDDPAIAARALKAGAKGYITKNDAPDTLAAAVDSVLAGRIWLDAAMARELALMTLAPPSDPLSALTAREQQILALIGRGLTAAAIAQRLGISHKTVANACTQIKDKLGADSPRALIRIAIDSGLAR
ncbi:response regulator [Azospirillum thermophilum]|uniref:DNA-binding response regulator n=1 Tax=Azospirillum thermophilum TaxID=2202148 RepID=A0A2S2CUK1_9PROT|nr:response regulator transcription factor [Azospirillum thermophilum]AWK88192.1 DNA-binding response regulator [Azospirillum thermophilum]